MRETELLTALAQAPGGVQVNISRTKVRVSTRYTPSVHAEGETLFQAAFACAKKVFERVEKYPSFRQYCPDVIEALEAYDRHTEILQL